MARQPVHLEMTGGKSPRQRVWEAMRTLRTGFSQADIAEHGRVRETVVEDYVKALLKGRYLIIASEQKVRRICIKRTYTLVKDNGLEAPRLTRAGKEVTQGGANEAMWGTLRRMFKVASVDYRQLAAFASTKTTPVTVETAKSYVLALAHAGYLECVQAAVKKPKPIPARYRLVPKMDSGSRAPMIQRTKNVFDPNWNRVVWRQAQEVADE